MASNIEREVKILNIDVCQIEESIIKNGGSLIAKEIQRNILIDSEKNPVKELTNGYLRIRETKDLLSGGENLEFTLKKNLQNTSARENLEYNVDIGDEKTLLNILKELGFNNIKVAYKERVSYFLLNCRIDIDTWDTDTYPRPYMEIEFKENDDLEKVVEVLKINRENISEKSIQELRADLNLL